MIRAGAIAGYLAALLEVGRVEAETMVLELDHVVVAGHVVGFHHAVEHSL